MNIAICDDEMKYRIELEGYLKEYASSRNVDFNITLFSEGEKLIQSEENYDFVLLDIEMDNMNGIETAKIINAKNRHTVIFIVTAYHKYLDDAMDLNVFRYIDKPIDKERIFAGFDKALSLLKNSEISFRTTDNEIVTVHKKDIIFVEVAKKRVTVATTDNVYTSREKMSFFRKNLDTEYFATPHNSYVANFNYVVKFKRDELVLKDYHIIPIAPKRQAEIKKQFISFVGDGYGTI